MKRNFLAAILILALAALGAPPALAQPADPPTLGGRQKNDLLVIARDAVDAQLEGRPPRVAAVGPRLQMAQGVVVSLWADGRMVGRSWQIRRAIPIFEAARVVTTQAIKEPKGGGPELDQETLSKVDITLSVLSGYAQVRDEKEVPPRVAVIVYNGFKEGVALPGDAPDNRPESMLNAACESAGLRPQAWLLPETTIFIANVDRASDDDQF